ncbi:hypothetical protein QR77_33745, partial [Streptomyces sp. 150FB]
MVLLLALIEVVTAVDPGLPGIAGLLDGSAAVVAGGLTASAQAGTVLLRRRRPRWAYAVLALVGVAQFVAIGAFPTYAWGVLAFSVARASGRAVGALVGPPLAA